MTNKRVETSINMSIFPKDSSALNGFKRHTIVYICICICVCSLVVWTLNHVAPPLVLRHGQIREICAATCAIGLEKDHKRGYAVTFVHLRVPVPVKVEETVDAVPLHFERLDPVAFAAPALQFPSPGPDIPQCIIRCQNGCLRYANVVIVVRFLA